jgi:hypothetical protein
MIGAGILDRRRDAIEGHAPLARIHPLQFPIRGGPALYDQFARNGETRELRKLS